MAIRTVVDVLKEKALLVAPEGKPFVLASGKTSPYYIDVRRATLDAASLYCIVQHLHRRLVVREIQPIRVAGVVVGGCPLATAVSLFSYAMAREGSFYSPVYDALYVRKELKGHGTGQLVEGIYGPGDPVLLLEDVVTSGASSLGAIKALREVGLNVLGVVSIVDRGQGGREALEREGVAFDALVGIEELFS